MSIEGEQIKKDLQKKGFSLREDGTVVVPCIYSDSSILLYMRNSELYACHAYPEYIHKMTVDSSELMKVDAGMFPESLLADDLKKAMLNIIELNTGSVFEEIPLLGKLQGLLVESVLKGGSK